MYGCEKRRLEYSAEGMCDCSFFFSRVIAVRFYKCRGLYFKDFFECAVGHTSDRRGSADNKLHCNFGCKYSKESILGENFFLRVIAGAVLLGMQLLTQFCV